MARPAPPRGGAWRIDMKQVRVILSKDIGLTLVLVFFFALLLVEAGCEPVPPTPPKPPSPVENTSGARRQAKELFIYTRYVPEKIDIIPLTEFVTVGKIRIYVSLLDSFDCQIKTPGIFRFELYRYVQHSAEPKGKRIAIWLDIDLTNTVENNNYWRDFLRAYEFNLDLTPTAAGFRPEKKQIYILQVTCLCPNGRRLSADFALKYTE